MANGTIKILFGTFLITKSLQSALKVSDSPPLVKLKYSLNTFWSQPETNRKLKRLSASISQHNMQGKPRDFLRLLIFFESFYRTRHIFPVISPVSKTFECLRAHYAICRYMFFRVIFER